MSSIQKLYLKMIVWNKMGFFPFRKKNKKTKNKKKYSKARSEMIDGRHSATVCKGAHGTQD